MPEGEAGQRLSGSAADDVVDELRTLIRDMRAWLEAMPITAEATGAIAADVIAPIQANWVGASRQSSDRQHVADASASDASVDTAGLDQTVAALDSHAAALTEIAARASESVLARGEQIDAILAEIRRVRAETATA